MLDVELWHVRQQGELKRGRWFVFHTDNLEKGTSDCGKTDHNSLQVPSFPDPIVLMSFVSV